MNDIRPNPTADFNFKKLTVIVKDYFQKQSSETINIKFMLFDFLESLKLE